MSFDELCSSVKWSKLTAIKAGMEPSEVWLGPTAAKALKDAVASPIAYGNGTVARATSRVDVEGAMLMGLYVRLMMHEGVRVGTSV